MEPEIARRCKACGASVRNHSGFCPQCGLSLTPEGAGDAAAPDAEISESATVPDDAAQAASAERAAEAQVEPSAETLRPTALMAETMPAAEPSPVMVDEEAVQAETLSDNGGLGAQESLVKTLEGTAPVVPTRRHRVKVAARDAVEEKIAPRVEKLRHASSVVLDEAADDPGVRFVLVAAALIIISFLLFLISHIL